MDGSGLNDVQDHGHLNFSDVGRYGYKSLSSVVIRFAISMMEASYLCSKNIKNHCLMDTAMHMQGLLVYLYEQDTQFCRYCRCVKFKTFLSVVHRKSKFKRVNIFFFSTVPGHIFH